jgi:hypothetical protein
MYGILKGQCKKGCLRVAHDRGGVAKGVPFSKEITIANQKSLPGSGKTSKSEIRWS